MKRLRKGFLTAEQGATAIEYAMLGATLSVPVILVFSYLAHDVLAVYYFLAQRFAELADKIVLPQ